MIQGPWVEGVLDSWLTGKSIKALLVTSAYADDPDVAFRSQITTEVTGTGYTAGGVPVTSPAASYDPATDVVTLTSDDVAFGTVTLSDVGGVVFYADTGSAATSPLIAADVFEAIEVTNTALTYRVDAAGIVAFSIGAA